jgi:hypothetical protein
MPKKILNVNRCNCITRETIQNSIGAIFDDLDKPDSWLCRRISLMARADVGKSPAFAGNSGSQLLIIV